MTKCTALTGLAVKGLKVKFSLVRCTSLLSTEDTAEAIARNALLDTTKRTIIPARLRMCPSFFLPRYHFVRERRFGNIYIHHLLCRAYFIVIINQLRIDEGRKGEMADHHLVIHRAVLISSWIMYFHCVTSYFIITPFTCRKRKILGRWNILGNVAQGRSGQKRRASLHAPKEPTKMKEVTWNATIHHDCS